MEPRAVIFDLDGTLLNSLEDIADSLNQVLIEMGSRPHPLEAYQDFIGSGAEELVERALKEEDRSPELIVAGAEAFRREYSRRWDAKTRPYPGIVEMLDHLQQLGIPQAILSNKPQKFTELSIEKYFPHHHFVAVIGQREGVPIKPDPTGAKEIAQLFGRRGSEILFLGDSGVDMETARRAGHFPVGVGWGFRPVEELLETGAAALIHHPAEIFGLLTKTSQSQGEVRCALCQ